MWGDDHPAAADVDADMVHLGRIEEDEVTGAQPGGRDGGRVDPLEPGEMAQGFTRSGPGVNNEAGAVELVRAGRRPQVGLADLGAGGAHRYPGRAADRRYRAGDRPER